MDNKICCECKKELSIENFACYGKKRKRIRSYCIDCWPEKNRQYRRVWYKNNTSLQILLSNERKKRVTEENKIRANALKIKCCICGYDKCKFALDFHHIKDKKYEISAMLLRGHCWNNIKKEIDKCIVVCSNCHRELTDGFITYMGV